MPIYEYKEMNVLVMEDLNYSNFTAQRKEQYPVLIDRALLSSDINDMVRNIYPEYFQRCEDHLCFNWQWFYQVLDDKERIDVFNNIMKIAYGNEVQYLIMRKKKLEGKVIDAFV